MAGFDIVSQEVSKEEKHGFVKLAETSMENEIMTLKQLSEYLQISQRSIHRMIKRGDIPAVKVTNRWRFERSTINEWLRKRAPINNGQGNVVGDRCISCTIDEGGSDV